MFQRGPKVRADRAILRDTEDAASAVLADVKAAKAARLGPLFKPSKKRIRTGISHVTEADNDDDGGDEVPMRKPHREQRHQRRDERVVENDDAAETVRNFIS